MESELFSISQKYLMSVSHMPASSAVRRNRLLAPEFDIDIIIPCYNAELYIEECISSVFNQDTSAKIRVTVIDDGSTDNSPALLDAYRDRQDFRLIRQKNSGVSAALNAAIEELSSSFLFFMGADDYLAPGAIEHLYRAVVSTNADVAEGRYIYVYPDGQTIPQPDITGQPATVSPFSLTGYSGGKLIRTSLFADICYPDSYWFEDSIFSFLIYPRAKSAVYIPSDTYMYRRNPSGSTAIAVGNKKSIDTWWILGQMLEDSRTLDIPASQQLYEMVLDHIALSYVRTQELGEDVLKAAFFYTAYIMSPLLGRFQSANRFHSILEKSLRLGIFDIFQSGCAIAWNSKLNHLNGGEPHP